MNVIYEFDDEVLKPERFRFHVLRTLSVGRHRKDLIDRQGGRCPLCPEPLDGKTPIEVDHIIPVKDFAYNVVRWPDLTEAYLECHGVENLQAVHRSCNQARRSDG